MEEEINYRILRKIQETEKNSPTLVELKPEFYKDLSSYLENLQNRLEKETTAQKQLLISDEIQNIKKITTNIYEQREKKILLAVVSAARGGKPDLKNMTNEEKNLFDSILEIMIALRKRFLETKTVKKEETGIKDNSKEEKPSKNNQPEEKQQNPNPIIKINQDIPEFIRTDEKKYNLRKNDVLSLPDDMSAMLIKRGAAEKINL